MKKITIKLALDPKDEEQRIQAHEIAKRQGLPPLDNVLDSFVYRVGIDAVLKSAQPKES